MRKKKAVDWKYKVSLQERKYWKARERNEEKVEQ